MRLNRQKFWKLYKQEFVGDSYLSQTEVDGLNYFLDRFETETRLKTIPEFAYVLATAYHESGKAQTIGGKRVMVRFQPVKETRESANSPRRANQDRYWKTGFYGRGFPQTTFERNYRKSGEMLGLGDLFVKNPDLLLEPKYAYDAMIICMVKGIYTGKSLSDYIFGKKCDYENARRIINGVDKAELIASYARKFEQVLKVSTQPGKPEAIAPGTEVSNPQSPVEPKGDAPPPAQNPSITSTTTTTAKNEQDVYTVRGGDTLTKTILQPTAF